MKTYVITIILFFGFLLGCNTQKNTTPPDTGAAQSVVGDTVRIANDELEYEIIIIDPGFSGWLASRARPRGYYSQTYFENKNRIWVSQWNSRVLDPRYSQLYLMRIEYDPSINYGYEVNYLLYNYLVYFQQRNRQKLGGVVPSF